MVPVFCLIATSQVPYVLTNPNEHAIGVQPCPIKNFFESVRELLLNLHAQVK
jgi:hypothetical protein